MKTIFYILITVAVWSCSSKPPVTTVKTQATSPCSLSNSSQCPPIKIAQDPAAEGEIKPFFENIAPDSMADKAIKHPPTDEELVEEPAAELAARKGVVEFDIPVVMNEDVERWMNYFQTSGRKYYANWLARSGKYIPMMQKILREHGLPQDLVYLSMIESGFKPYAYSRARAMGPWQFIRGTGSRYGLRVDWMIDERRDPEKSTVAAAQHLKDLYDQFNHWYLAAAGYNAGAMKITRAIERYSTEDFWEMTQFRYLKPETKNYVPKLLAAAIIAKQPENYGFTGIVYEEPLQYAKVHVPESVELAIVAEKLSIDVEILEDLNPELLRGHTPINYPDYELKIPVGLESLFLEKYPEIRKESSSVRVVRHVVGPRDTLGTIAKRYGTTIGDLMAANQLRSSRVRSGQTLVIPAKRRTSSRQRPVTNSAHRPQARVSTDSKKYHKVARGETLWSISQKYDVTVDQLKSWNNLDQGKILPGKQLALRQSSEGGLLVPKRAQEKSEWTTYRVKSGDSLWTISRAHGVSLDQLRNWNDLEHGKIFPGKILKIKTR